MLDVTSLTKTYGTGASAVEAIRDLSFDVADGEFVTIVGPSGSGKTTMLRCLSGLMRPSGGEVRVHGDPVTEPHPDIALVFQDYTRALMPWYSVLQNVMLPIENKIRDKSERKAVAQEALVEVGLGDMASKYPWQLSGGMQQRVALARGLAYRPKIMLLDEPFASVDAQTRNELEDLVLQVCADLNMTALLVTHDIDEAVYLADRVVVVSRRPSVVSEIITVDLPRPRHQIETKALPEFSEHRARISHLLHGGAAA